MRLRDLKLLPVALYALAAFGVLVLTSGWLWLVIGRAVVSGDFARHPIASVVAILAALPLLAPVAVGGWFVGLGLWHLARQKR